MQPSFRDPLEGKPATVETATPDGLIRFHIMPSVLTPLRAKVADCLSSLLITVLWVGGLYLILASWPLPDAQLMAAIGVGLAAAPLLRWATRAALRRRTDIVMTADAIAVRGWLGWKRYSRHLEHRFALHIHDLAAQEHRDNDYKVRKAASKGNVITRLPYYGSSFHVVLLYAGHRVDLLTVFGHAEAAAIVARLQYCDRCLNEALAMGGGISKRPEDEWDDAPGGINRG